MSWLVELVTGESVAHAILVIGLVAVLGLMIGNIRVAGISLGIAGVLFAGLAFGHFHISINKEVMEFLRDFGLIFFVYSIGLQVGPSFFSSLRKQGLRLNIMAGSIVLLGVATTLAVAYIGRIPMTVAVGLFSGATTNTPSLAAAQQALKDAPGLGADASAMPGVGYAIAYPFGVMGIILCMLLTRTVFRVNVKQEVADFTAQQEETPKIVTRNLEVRNPGLNGMLVNNVPELAHSNVVISRIMRNDEVAVATPQSTISEGDVMLGVGSPEELERLERIVGGSSDIELKDLPGDIVTHRIIVTKEAVIGKSLSQLNLIGREGVVFTRVRRMELEFTVNPNFTLQFGDSLLVVGQLEAIKEVEEKLGNTPSQLEHPRVIPLFVGISLGVLIGSIPIPIPGVPVPVKLGLAGGPLLVALILSRIGKIGSFSFYLPKSANMMLREVGIILFLACVGLKAGEKFVATLEGPGLAWMGYGAIVTLLPLLIVGLAARIIWKVGFPTLCGLLSGSMTDPPALAFAGQITDSEAPSLSYATVYPLVMLMRVVSAQMIVIFFVHPPQ